MKIFLKIFPLIAGLVSFVFILGCRQHIVKPAAIQVKSATIPPKDTAVVDIDGNVYSSVTIGTQTWLVENLKTTRYRNGDTIGNVTDGDLWHNLISDAYCDYNNDSSNAETYGCLYNWFAVDDDRGIAPAGWHVATNEEWITLSTYLADGDYLKGSRESGDQLKESGTLHWANGNTGNNKSGFTALPGGERVYTNSKYEGMGLYGKWWTATEYNDYAPGDYYKDSGLDGYVWCMSYYTGYTLSYGTSKKAGSSVRCVKD